MYVQKTATIKNMKGRSIHQRCIIPNENLDLQKETKSTRDSKIEGEYKLDIFSLL